MHTTYTYCKAKLVGDLMAKYEDSCPDSVAAKELSKPTGGSVVLSRMQQRLKPSIAVVASVSSNQPDSPGAKSWQDLWHSIFVEETASHQLAEPPLEDSCSLTAAVRRYVIAMVQSLVLNIVPKGPKKQGENMSNVMVAISLDKNANKKVDYLYQQDATPTKLHYWGRVVDASVAKNLPRANIMSLGSSHDLQLFLDGGPYMSCDRSDMCPAWFVKPAKAAKPEHEEEHPTKKRKKKATTAKLDEVVTHEIAYTPFAVVIELESSQKVTFRYEKPFLQTIERLESLDFDWPELPLKRAPTQFDSFEFAAEAPAKRAKAAEASSVVFATR